MSFDSNIHKNDLFIEKHVGGNLDDTIDEYKNQQKIINKNTHNYINSLNEDNKNKRDKNIKSQQKEKYNKNYRINNVPTIVNDTNISNPIIYPTKFDPHFEYLNDKNLNPINNQVVLDKTYVNIDSANRTITTTSTINSFITLINNPLLFENNSSIMKILVNNSNKDFIQGDKISLTGFDFYNINYKNMKFYFKNNSKQVVLDINPNFDITIPYYNIMIKIENVTNNGLNYFKNIPLNIINTIAQVTSVNENGDIKLTFNMPITFYTENELDSTMISDCVVTFYSLGNYPLNLINAHYPITEFNLIGNYTILNSSKKYITVKLTNELSITNSINLNGQWINDVFHTGGANIQISKIISIEEGYKDICDYAIRLNKIINNIVSIKMISSEFPDTQKIFNNYTTKNNIKISNNKLYWENALDTNLYSVSIPVGNYDSNDLKTIIELTISKVKRIFINSTNIIPYNDMKFIFDTDSNITSVTSFNNYILPKSLISVTNDGVSNDYIIKINHPQHDLQINDIIIIQNSINYQKISQKYINTEHFVTNILNVDNYEITLTNINLIPDIENTNGGNEIIIKTKNSFRMFFDKSDTCGNQIGFKFSGNVGSITPYSNINNDYIITNQQPYIFDIGKILIVNNKTSNIQKGFDDINLTGFKYFLIQCNDFNVNSNPNNIDYFYKIQIKSKNQNTLFNTYVDAPVIFNPPLKSLSQLSFVFYDPNGNKWNFYNINHSFTLEITNISNYPENTNINTFTSRI
jgi:hypothetical protein